jgi:E3 ubiquitin-protein ligase synoviolin
MYSIIRYSGPLHATSSTSQSGEASTSNQSQDNRQNTGDLSASQPFISHGPVSSTASNTDLEKALQMAYEKAIRNQIEVIIIFLLTQPALIFYSICGGPNKCVPYENDLS